MSMKQLINFSRLRNLMPQLRREKNAIASIPGNKQSRRLAQKNAASKVALDKLSLPAIEKISSASASKVSKLKTENNDEKDGRKHRSIRSSKVEKNPAASDTLATSFSNLSINARISSKISAVPSSSRVRHMSTLTVSNVNEFASLIKSGKCKNIIVMAGAGISTPSGIPDFRTPGTGLYDNLAEYNLPDPTAVFDISFFSYNPRPFFRLAKELYPGNFPPNAVHHFVKLLHDKGLLLRMYTQNIDALERAAGIPESKLVEAHGSFATATCRKCKTNYKGEDILEDVMKDEIPKCRNGGCSGVIKPDIVFFGEDLPKKFFLFHKDFAKCDMLIVLGTSLEVEPFAGLVNEVKLSVPRLLINREVVGPFVKRKRRSNDLIIKGDIVHGVDKLLTALSWNGELDNILQQKTKE